MTVPKWLRRLGGVVSIKPKQRSRLEKLPNVLEPPVQQAHPDKQSPSKPTHSSPPQCNNPRQFPATRNPPKATLLHERAFQDDIHIFIQTLTGRSLLLDVATTCSIKYIKSKVEEKERIPIDLQHLSFAGKILEDGRLLDHYDIRKCSTLQLSLRLRAGSTVVVDYDDGDLSWRELASDAVLRLSRRVTQQCWDPRVLWSPSTLERERFLREEYSKLRTFAAALPSHEPTLPHGPQRLQRLQHSLNVMRPPVRKPSVLKLNAIDVIT
ncbi:uncharacterized protein PAC_09841 [Phialocephala subalpina]|uniref:Ubiquitin-like domain-containing protein n=1 Tax=Phialocephala subalpina TaxID=576137 RepID=A0A1L7X4J3_9HELO|nr:uncharacterized protein PAC_09841 [Phialocephala subalpina]